MRSTSANASAARARSAGSILVTTGRVSGRPAGVGDGRPTGLRHLEDPELAGDLSTAREFDLGITGVPMYLALDFVTAGFVQFLAGVVAAAVLAGYTWWGALVLLVAWMATHVLLRESGIWKDRNTEPVQQARRDAEYAFEVAVEPAFAKELRLILDMDELGAEYQSRLTDRL